MKKKEFIKKVYSLLVATLFIIPTGCSNETVKQTPITAEQLDTGTVLGMGAYLTKEIDIPTVAKGYLTQDEVGNIYCYDVGDMCTIYILDEEDVWKRQGQIKLPDNIRKIYKIFNVSGKMQIVFGNKAGEMSVAKEGQQNKFETFTLTKEGKPIQENANVAKNIDLDEAQNIYMSMGQGKIQRYDGKNGKWVQEYLDEVSDFIIINEQILGVLKQEKDIKVYDCKTGDVRKTISYNGNGQTKLFKGIDKESFYACNDQGIIYLSSEEAALWERVVTPDILKTKNRRVKEYAIYPCGTDFLIYYDREDGGVLEKCYYKSDYATVPSKVVNIYMLYEDEQVRKAAEIYQNQHKDVRVNVNSAIRGKRYISEYAILSKDMAASDADLLVLDGHIYNYVQDGNVADLTDVVEQLVKTDVLNQQIANSLKMNNKYYAIPLTYGGGMIWGNSEIINKVNTLEDLAAYKKQHPEQILLGETKQELFRQFIDSCFLSWFDETGAFDEASYKSFLESITTLEEEKYDNLKANSYCENIGFNNENKKAEILDVAQGKTQLVSVGTYSLKELSEIADMLKGRKDIAQKELIGQGISGVYYGGSIMAINAYSQNQDIAKEIIKIALSEEVQNTGNECRISTNHKVFDARLNQMLQLEENTSRYTQFEEWNSNLQVCANNYDYKLYTIISTETEAYCRGHQTIDDTVQSIKTKIAQTK